MSARIYSVLLALYPVDLRRDFGAEMMEVFLEDLEARRRCGGFVGAARVWWRSIEELCRIVLPGEASRPEIAVPFFMYALVAMYMGLGLLAQDVPGATRIMVVSSARFWHICLQSGIVPAFVAFIAVRVGGHSVPVPLGLSGK